MSVRFYTETHSVYEVEFALGPDGEPRGGRIRRESGRTPPTECFAPDGTWHGFHAISLLQEGHPVSIMWPPDAPHDATVTSYVTRIEEL